LQQSSRGWCRKNRPNFAPLGFVPNQPKHTQHPQDHPRSGDSPHRGNFWIATAISSTVGSS
jgi:hypothetical protein